MGTGTFSSVLLIAGATPGISGGGVGAETGACSPGVLRVGAAGTSGVATGDSVGWRPGDPGTTRISGGVVFRPVTGVAVGVRVGSATISEVEAVASNDAIAVPETLRSLTGPALVAIREKVAGAAKPRMVPNESGSDCAAPLSPTADGDDVSGENTLAATDVMQVLSGYRSANAGLIIGGPAATRSCRASECARGRGFRFVTTPPSPGGRAR